MTQDIRWTQRFQNFDKAVNLLREPIERGIDTLSILEKEGTMQRFEVAVELAWKTLKDYLEYEGVKIKMASPRHIIKEAFAAGVIQGGDLWIDMLNHRNLLSHTYDSVLFAEAIVAVNDRYLAALIVLRDWLREKLP